MLDQGFYLVMKNENIPLSSLELNSIITQLVELYNGMGDEIEELSNVSKINIELADRLVRRRYKDFYIN